MPPRRLHARECPAGLLADAVAGRVRVDGPGWSWIVGDGGAFHVTGPCGPRSPRTVVVDSVPHMAIGTTLTVELGDAVRRPRPAPPAPAPPERILELCDLMRPHLWNDPHTLALATKPFTEVAPHIIGRGPGLTPACDDAICGYLTARFAIVAPDAASDGDRIVECLDRTTEPSRSLLAEAARDGATYEVAEVVCHALAGGATDPLIPALHDLLTLGRTTGRALLTGIVCGLTAPVPDSTIP